MFIFIYTCAFDSWTVEQIHLPRRMLVFSFLSFREAFARSFIDTCTDTVVLNVGKGNVPLLFSRYSLTMKWSSTLSGAWEKENWDYFITRVYKSYTKCLPRSAVMSCILGFCMMLLYMGFYLSQPLWIFDTSLTVALGHWIKSLDSEMDFR